jgi:hypothetical protein
MLNKLPCNKGGTNLLLIIVLMGFSVMILLLFAAAVFVSHLNSLLYTIKVDMFTINRSAILALNRETEKGNIDSIDRNSYYNYFKKVLQYNYNLDSDLRSGNKFIEKIDILQYEYYSNSVVDNVSGKLLTEPTIHTEIGVKVTPIVFGDIFADLFYIHIHQDVKVKRVLD